MPVADALPAINPTPANAINALFNNVFFIVCSLLLVLKEFPLHTIMPTLADLVVVPL